jgi:tRNA synthetases class I (E and Q), anti-codon binding domain
MKWGNVTISSKEVHENGLFTLKGKLDLNDKDFKKTKKITWLAADPETLCEVTMIEYDHLISKKKLEDNEAVNDFVNKDSKISYIGLAEGSMRNL